MEKERTSLSGLGRILAGLAVVEASIFGLGGCVAGLVRSGRIEYGYEQTSQMVSTIDYRQKGKGNPEIVKTGWGVYINFYDRDGIKKAYVFDSKGDVVLDFEKLLDENKKSKETPYWSYEVREPYNKIDKDEKYTLYIEDLKGNILKIPERIDVKEKGIDDITFERKIWKIKGSNSLNIDISDFDGIRRAYLRDKEGNIVYELEANGKPRIMEWFDRGRADREGLDVDKDYFLYVEDNKGNKETRKVRTRRMRRRDNDNWSGVLRGL